MRIVFFILALSFAINSHSNCFEGPVTRRILIVWNGLADMPLFNQEVKAAFYSVGKMSQKNFALLGPTATKVEANDMTNFEASPKNLRKVSESINQDYLQFLAQGGKPGSYEVVFTITNHGGQEIMPDGKKKYFIPSGADDSKALDESDLKKFGKALPPGIRFKALFTECFSANHLSTVLSEVDSKTCACGVAVSDYGMAASGTEGRGVISDIFRKMVDGESMQEAAWDSYAKWGGYSASVGMGQNKSALNAFLSTSEMLAAEKMMKGGASRIHDLENEISTKLVGADLSHENLLYREMHAQKKKLLEEYLKSYQMGPKDVDQRVQAGLKTEDEKAQVSEATDILIKKIGDLLEEGKNTKDEARIVQINQENKLLMEKIEKTPLQSPQSATARLYSRSMMEQEFLKSSDKAQIEKYERMKNCEKESFDFVGTPVDCVHCGAKP